MFSWRKTFYNLFWCISISNISAMLQTYKIDFACKKPVNNKITQFKDYFNITGVRFRRQQPSQLFFSLQCQWKIHFGDAGTSTEYQTKANYVQIGLDYLISRCTFIHKYIKYIEPVCCLSVFNISAVALRKWMLVWFVFPVCIIHNLASIMIWIGFA